MEQKKNVIRFCPNCGNKTDQNEAFCGNCGTPHVGTMQPSQNTKKIPKWPFIVGGGILAFICIILVLTIAITPSLLLDRRSEEAKAVDNLISAIGEVTLGTKNQVEEAEKAVAKLEEEDKKHLRNQKSLIQARNTLNSLLAAEIDKAILTIGTVTKNSADEIKKAREKYDTVDVDVRKLVTKYAELESAENSYNNILVNIVIEKINAIGTVTLKSEKDIEAANLAYDQLNFTNKTKVTNYSTLTAAEKKLQELQSAEREKKFKSLTSGMRITKDGVTGNIFYYPSVFPNYINTRCYILPYIVKNGDDILICVRYNYTGDDWVFFKKIIFAFDNENITRSFDYFDITHDNKSGDVWEHHTDVANYQDISILREITTSNKRIARFQGDDYHYDYTIPSSDQAAIKKILEIYDLYYK